VPSRKESVETAAASVRAAVRSMSSVTVRASLTMAPIPTPGNAYTTHGVILFETAWDYR